MDDRDEQISSEAEVHDGDSGRRRPAHYSSEDQVDVDLPELRYVPAEGPLDREYFEGKGDEEARED